MGKIVRKVAKDLQAICEGFKLYSSSSLLTVNFILSS